MLLLYGAQLHVQNQVSTSAGAVQDGVITGTEGTELVEATPEPAFSSTGIHDPSATST